MLQPTAPLSFQQREETRTSQEDRFTQRCDQLIQSLTDFWPSQIAAHFHLIDLDGALSASIDPMDDPRFALSPFEYDAKLAKLTGDVREGVVEFSEGIRGIRYFGVEEGRVSPSGRYVMWKESCGGVEMGTVVGPGLEVRHSDCVRGWRYDYEEACALLHEIKEIATTYKNPSFPSHSTYFLAGQEFCQVNDRTRWAMLRVLKTAFLTFCEMSPVSRPFPRMQVGVYNYRGCEGMRRFRMDWNGEFDLFLDNVLQYVFWMCPSPGMEYLKRVTYGDLENEILRVRERRPDFDVPSEWEEPFGAV